MSTYPVQITGLSPSTSRAQLYDFFTFCGTIHSIEQEEKSTSATVHFDKASAARTALMLNGGALDGATLSVTSDAVKEDDPVVTEESARDIDQSDKPRAAIAAEFLAKGYSLSEQVLQRSIEIDQKHGISKTFLDYMQQLDTKVGERAFGPDKKVSAAVQEKVDEQIKQAKALDEQKGFSKIAHDYYEKAISSSLGQKVLAFYTNTSKQVHDIHEEALRIAQEEQRKSTTTAQGSDGLPAPTDRAPPTVV